jgi:hypothetical protein
MPSARLLAAIPGAEGDGGAKMNDCLSKCGRARHPVKKKTAATGMALMVLWIVMDHYLLAG